MAVLRSITPTTARRLAISAQRLAGPTPVADAQEMLTVVRQLGCLQLDPISVVARSHLLVLWSRLGAFDRDDLDRLLWQERRLFEYWAHCASIVLTEDYPLHRPMMRDHGSGGSAHGRRIRQWVDENRGLHDHIIEQLEQRGPLPSRVFEDRSAWGWYSKGWTSGRNVSKLLDYLWLSGRIMVAGRTGQQKLWDLTERCLRDDAPQTTLSDEEVVRQAVQRALRALGVATAAQIRQHFIRGRYPGLAQALAGLEADQAIVRVQIAGDGGHWPGVWYANAADLALLDRIEAGDWRPRTTLLSPFDNLICDRARTERLFDFRFRIEIYTPAAKRQHGYYVLPVLAGDRLIGRIDPVYDRSARTLRLRAVHAEPDLALDPASVAAVATAVEDLARFLGATDVQYPAAVPAGWQSLGRRLVY